MTKEAAREWEAVKLAYQRGEGSCKVLAEKFGMTHAAVRRRCDRHKWRIERKHIDAGVVEKVQRVLVDEATHFLRETIRRGMIYQKHIDNHLAKHPDSGKLDELSRTEVRINDMIRKAFGIPDAPQRVELDANLMIQVVDPYSREVQTQESVHVAVQVEEVKDGA